MEIQCAICLDNLFTCDEGESIYSTNCGHLFHYNCLSQWTESSNTCPECRQNVSIDSILKLNVHVNFEEKTRATISKRITRSSANNSPQNRVLRSELELKSSQLDLKVKELRFKNIELQRMENKYKSIEKEIDELRFENDKLQLEIGKLKSELQSEKEKNVIIRSDLRIMDIIDLEAGSSVSSEENRNASDITHLIDLTTF